MDNFSGAIGAGMNAPKKDHALAGDPILNPRPFKRSADGDFDVAGDSIVKYNYANCDNGNEDGMSGAKPNGNAPDTVVSTPQGKPL